jgi:hypothetical protein
MIRKRLIVLVAALAMVYSVAPFTGCAQEIPLTSWRTHTSYNRIHCIVSGNSNNQKLIVAAAEHGLEILRFNGSEVTSSTLSKLNGLSTTDITGLAYDQTRNQLLVSYADGTLDIVRNNEIIQYTQLKNSTTISGSKQINSIQIRQNLAYLSTDYGVVVFNLDQLQVIETWRDLGVGGQPLVIHQSAFLGDSVFLANDQGILAGDLNSNLLDFVNWKRFDQGIFNTSITTLASFSGMIYAGINGEGLYHYQSGVWSLAELAGNSFNSLSAGNQLIITTNNQVWRLSNTNVLSEISNTSINSPLYAMEDADGIIWIGDSRNGLFTNQGNAYVPNGVSYSETFRLGRDATQAIYAVSGGYTSTFQPLGKNERVNSFSSGLWNINTSFLSQDVTDIAFSGSKAFVASFGSGLQVIENGIETIFTNSNSPLSTNRITALAISNDGVWITNYGGAQSLHLLKADGTWESFSFPYSGSQNPLQLVVDQIGQVWMALNPSVGGGLIVFNRKENKSVLLSEVVGAGALPSRQVYSLAVDRSGQVWVGTAAGVAYFTNPSQVFSGNVNSIKPIYNGRFLLRDETVTALAVDGGNRKWIGTLRGTWLFNPFGEEEIYNFNTGNSPLLSDKISDIEINPVTGEVFFATEKGIISFRSDATSSENDFNEVKIFPNPVAADFNGLISISGLATDARIKVIDISGKLVWQTIANGGTATWNARDYNGRRAATGMYLVIAVSQDGSESVIGKIAVLN